MGSGRYRHWSVSGRGCVEWEGQVGGTARVEVQWWEASGSGQQGDNGPEGSGMARLQGRGG